MFNFTTQTVFNSLIISKDTDPVKNANVIIKTKEKKNPTLRIGNVRFTKGDVIDIQEKKHTPESLASVTFDISQAINLVKAGDKDVQEGDYRIVLYLGLSMNSQDSFYANDLVYKGKPLFIEFPIKAADTPADVAKRVKKIADKYMLFMAQERILDVTVDDTKVTFEGVNGYQLIKKAALQKYDPNASQIDCCNNNGDFVDVITGVPVVYTVNADGEVEVGEEVETLDVDGIRALNSNEVAIMPGLEAFGDYSWMIHNLRLPTLANTYFWAVTKSEMPVAGATYDQFIIRLCKERDGIGGEVVGQRATSVTTHVLYVKSDDPNKAQLVEALKSVLNSSSDYKKEADDALAEPFKGASED